MASANVKSTEKKNAIVPQTVGASPDLSELDAPAAAAPQPAAAGASTGQPRLQEFADAAKPSTDPVSKPASPIAPAVEEIGEYSPLLGADVFYWRLENVNGVVKLMPKPGKLVRQGLTDKSKWKVLIFLETGKLVDYNDVSQADAPKANCFTLKK